MEAGHFPDPRCRIDAALMVAAILLRLEKRPAPRGTGLRFPGRQGGYSFDGSGAQRGGAPG
jgi:hypothetical protein